jgi:hypothetical protein
MKRTIWCTNLVLQIGFIGQVTILPYTNLTFKGCSFLMWPLTDVLLPRASHEVSIQITFLFDCHTLLRMVIELQDQLETIVTTSKQVTVICDFGHSSSSSNLDIKNMMRSTVVECTCDNKETITTTSKQVTVICDFGHSCSSSNLDVKKHDEECGCSK